MGSNLTVTVAANSVKLCQRADVKALLNIAAADTSKDAEIDTLILVASAAIEYELDREPWLQTYLEKRPGDGGRLLYLSRWPLKGDPASVTVGTGSSPTTVTASDYSVKGRRRDALYNSTCWNLSERDLPVSIPEPMDRPLDYNVTYTAGWIMPDEISTWEASAAVAANAWYGALAKADHGYIFQANATGGTSAATEPTWPTVEEGTVTDNDFDFTAYRQRLPHDLERAAIVQVMDYYGGGLNAPAPHIAEESAGGFRMRYRDVANDAGVTSAVRAICRRYAN